MSQKPGPTQAQLESDLWVLLETSVPKVPFDVGLLPVVAKWAHLKIQEVYELLEVEADNAYNDGYDIGYADGVDDATLDNSPD